MCGHAPRDATEPCARCCMRALESKRPKASLSHPRPGPLQQRLRRRAGWAALRPAHCAGCLLWGLGGHAGILARTATTHGVGMCTSTDCEARAGRNAPLGQHSSAPHAQPRVPGTGPGNWPHGWQFHASRTRSLYFFAIARFGAGSPGTVPVGSTSRRAHGHSHGQVRLAAAGGRANHSSQSQHGHGCRRRLDPWGDDALACARSGLCACSSCRRRCPHSRT